MKIILKYRSVYICLTVCGIFLIIIGVGIRHLWTDPDIVLLVSEAKLSGSVTASCPH
jgi:hypothetical protein